MKVNFEKWIGDYSVQAELEIDTSIKTDVEFAGEVASVVFGISPEEMRMKIYGNDE